MEDLGAGVIIDTIDKEGTGDGFDIEFVEKVSSAVKNSNYCTWGGPSKIPSIF